MELSENGKVQKRYVRGIKLQLSRVQIYIELQDYLSMRQGIFLMVLFCQIISGIIFLKVMTGR